LVVEQASVMPFKQRESEKAVPFAFRLKVVVMNGGHENG
jgi:hypothetical protein